MSVVLSTDQVQPADRAAYWHEVICRTFVQLDVSTSARRFAGRVTSTPVGPIRFSRIDAHPMGVRRSDRHIAEAREDELLLALHLTGMATGHQDDRLARLAPGDLALFDAARPYSVKFDGAAAFAHLVVQVPRALLQARVGRLESATAMPIRRAEPVGGLVSSFLVGLARSAGTLDPALAGPLAHHALDLIATAIGTRTGGQQVTGESMQALHRQRVHAFIEAHLHDPGLSARSIADAQHISVRYLHKLFADQPTSLLRTVWEQRLDRCRRDLENPALAARSTADIARRWGFQSASHFSRAFKARFGQPPGLIRRNAPATSPAAPRRS